MCDEGGCFRSFAKVFLIIVNIIFLLAGLLMLAFGIALVVVPEKVINFIMTSGINFTSFDNTSGGFFTEIIKACGIFMIILGGVVAIVAFFGFFGACCDSKCLLVTYAIILIIIVLAEVALIIFAAVYPQVFEDTAKKALKESLNEFKQDVKINSSGSIDANGIAINDAIWMAFQTEFQCCGSSNSTDYMNLKQDAPWKRTQCDTCNEAGQVPLSCCKLKDANSDKAMDTLTTNDYVNYQECLKDAKSQYTNQIGCTPDIINSARDFLKKYSKIAIGIAAGIIGLEIILIVLAFVICCLRDGSSKYV